ncbi:MAG: (2Fe-2S) ferredoxin domain-containing protein [Candidatus Desantisbacteria bacterium]
MAKLTIDDLIKIKEQYKATSTLREGGYRARFIIHMGTCGIASGARGVMSALMDEIMQQNMTDVTVTTSGCAGLCSREPMVTVELAGKSPVKYVDLDGEKIKKILLEHVIGGNIVEEYALGIGNEATY